MKKIIIIAIALFTTIISCSRKLVPADTNYYKYLKIVNNNRSVGVTESTKIYKNHYEILIPYDDAKIYYDICSDSYVIVYKTGEMIFIGENPIFTKPLKEGEYICTEKDLSEVCYLLRSILIKYSISVDCYNQKSMMVAYGDKFFLFYNFSGKFKEEHYNTIRESLKIDSKKNLIDNVQ